MKNAVVIFGIPMETFERLSVTTKLQFVIIYDYMLFLYTSSSMIYALIETLENKSKVKFKATKGIPVYDFF